MREATYNKKVRELKKRRDSISDEIAGLEQEWGINIDNKLAERSLGKCYIRTDRDSYVQFEVCRVVAIERDPKSGRLSPVTDLLQVTDHWIETKFGMNELRYGNWKEIPVDRYQRCWDRAAKKVESLRQLAPKS